MPISAKEDGRVILKVPYDSNLTVEEIMEKAKEQEMLRNAEFFNREVAINPEKKPVDVDEAIQILHNSPCTFFYDSDPARYTINQQELTKLIEYIRNL